MARWRGNVASAILRIIHHLKSYTGADMRSLFHQQLIPSWMCVTSATASCCVVMDVGPVSLSGRSLALLVLKFAYDGQGQGGKLPPASSSDGQLYWTGLWQDCNLVEGLYIIILVRIWKTDKRKAYKMHLIGKSETVKSLGSVRCLVFLEINSYFYSALNWSKMTVNTFTLLEKI